MATLSLSLYPAVSASPSIPPPLLPSLPLGIECSQSGRWVECIIHGLFGGLGERECVCMCVCSQSTGSRLWSHYRSNGCVLDAAPCQSHLKCKSQMSVKRFITHALCVCAPPPPHPSSCKATDQWCSHNFLTDMWDVCMCVSVQVCVFWRTCKVHARRSESKSFVLHSSWFFCLLALVDWLSFPNYCDYGKMRPMYHNVV